MGHHQSIREVMAKDPVTLPSSASAIDAAKQMKNADIGNVLVLENENVHGILTDRDIAIRVVAEGRDPQSVTLDEIATKGLETVSPDDSIEDAKRLMSEKAVRRLPVIENGQPVGIVSLGDIANAGHAEPALEDISKAPPQQ